MVISAYSMGRVYVLYVKMRGMCSVECVSEYACECDEDSG